MKNYKKLCTFLGCVYLMAFSCAYAHVTGTSGDTYTVDSYGAEFSYEVDASFQRVAIPESSPLGGTGNLGLKGPKGSPTPVKLLDMKGASHW